MATTMTAKNSATLAVVNPGVNSLAELRKIISVNRKLLIVGGGATARS